MSVESRPSVTEAARRKTSPVRVRLKRVSCEHAQAYPPNGMQRDWWQRLKNALGTASSSFVDASLFQLMAAARLPGSGTSEIAVNAALALIEGAKPREEIETALVIQMACTHSAAMTVLGRLSCGHGTDRNILAKATAATRLLRTYAMQVETMRRLRNGASQFVRVEHVHIGDGGQAVIGCVATDQKHGR